MASAECGIGLNMGFQPAGICVHRRSSAVKQFPESGFVNFAPFRGDLFRGFIREIRAIRGEI